MPWSKCYLFIDFLSGQCLQIFHIREWCHYHVWENLSSWRRIAKSSLQNLRATTQETFPLQLRSELSENASRIADTCR